MEHASVTSAQMRPPMQQVGVRRLTQRLQHLQPLRRTQAWKPAAGVRPLMVALHHQHRYWDVACAPSHFMQRLLSDLLTCQGGGTRDEAGPQGWLFSS